MRGLFEFTGWQLIQNLPKKNPKFYDILSQIKSHFLFLKRLDLCKNQSSFGVSGA